MVTISAITSILTNLPRFALLSTSVPSEPDELAKIGQKTTKITVKLVGRYSAT